MDWVIGIVRFRMKFSRLAMRVCSAVVSRVVLN